MKHAEKYFTHRLDSTTWAVATLETITSKDGTKKSYKRLYGEYDTKKRTDFEVKILNDNHKAKQHQERQQAERERYGNRNYPNAA